MGIGANFAVFYPLLKYVSGEFPLYVVFNFLGILAATVVNFVLSSRLGFKPSLPRNLDPHAPPKVVAEEIRRELILRGGAWDIEKSAMVRSIFEARRRR